jgi:hypothetical protein
VSGAQVAAVAIGVLIGALGTFIANELSDRAKARRETRAAWRDRRLDAYEQFAQAAKAFQRLLYRRGSALGNGPDLDPLTKAEAEPLFRQEYDRRDEQFELMLLYAPSAVHHAARDWVAQLSELRRMVDAEMTDPDRWRQHADLAQQYRASFHAAARHDTGVPDVTPVHWWRRRSAAAVADQLKGDPDRFVTRQKWSPPPDIADGDA